jgi:hypothetical protein
MLFKFIRCCFLPRSSQNFLFGTTFPSLVIFRTQPVCDLTFGRSLDNLGSWMTRLLDSTIHVRVGLSWPNKLILVFVVGLGADNPVRHILLKCFVLGNTFYVKTKYNSSLGHFVNYSID